MKYAVHFILNQLSVAIFQRWILKVSQLSGFVCADVSIGDFPFGIPFGFNVDY